MGAARQGVPEMRRYAELPRPPYTLIALFFSLALVIVATAAVLYGRHEHEIKEARYRDLQALSRLMADRIEGWLDDRQALAVAAARACEGIIEREGPVSGRTSVARDMVRDWLVAVGRIEGHSSAHFLDASLRVAVHADRGTCALRQDAPKLASEAMRLRTTVWGGPHRYGRDVWGLSLAAPVADTRNDGGRRAVGAVVVDLDATNTVFDLFRGWPSPTSSLETLLLMPGSGLVVRLRSHGGPALPMPPSTAPLDPGDFTVVQALEGRRGHLRGRLHDGPEVYAYITDIAGTTWQLVVRERADEATAPLRMFGGLWIAIVLASVAASFAGAFAVWRHQRAGHYRALYEAEIEQSRSQRDLYRSRAVLQLVLDNIPQRVFWKDTESRYLGFNLPFARDAGFERPEELLGKDDYAMCWKALAEQYRADDRAVMQTGETKLAYVEPQATAAGQLLWVRTSKVPLRDENGAITGVLGTYEDITEQIRTEVDLRNTTRELEQKNQELTGVLSAVSHDLRAPLVNIAGFASELRISMEELKGALHGAEPGGEAAERMRRVMDDEMPHAIGTITDNATRMDRLLNGVLTISRLGRAELATQPLKMTELVSAVAAGLEYEAKENGVTVEVGALPNCEGTPIHIGRVFENLLSNAIKYRDSARSGRVRITGQVQQGMAVYCVEDNGIGIAAEDTERVFELFRRVGPARVEGDGIGLTTVRTIVDRHGGRVWVESAPGVGSRFYVSLPTTGPGGKQRRGIGSGNG